MEGKEIILVDKLRREFMVGGERVKALRGVSFSIAEGEFVTIMGTSGSGKSTLLNILGCLDTPTSGEYMLDGVLVQSMSKNQRAITRNRKIGFVFQNYNLLPKTTSIENVELPLPSRHANGARKRSRHLRLWGCMTGCTTRATRCRAVSSSVWQSHARSSTIQ